MVMWRRTLLCGCELDQARGGEHNTGEESRVLHVELS